MVVDHDDLDPAFRGIRQGLEGGDAAIDRHHDTGAAPLQRLKPGEVGSVALGDAVGDIDFDARADRFEEGSQVAFWTRVTGGQPGDVISHVWFHEGQAVMRADLEIGSADWRTFSRRVLPDGATGDWLVEARGPDGGLLARLEFSCVPDES